MRRPTLGVGARLRAVPAKGDCPLFPLAQLRWRPRSNRIGRNRQIISQPGLEVFLLPAQPTATIEGAQLTAQRPDGGPDRGHLIQRVYAQAWRSGLTGRIMRRAPLRGVRRAAVIRP